MIIHNIKCYSCLIIISVLISACEREISVSPIIESQLESSAIFIDSNPIGANIWVDGRPSGCFTPDTVKWLKEGIHKIVLKADLFEDHEFELLGKNDSVLNYYYDYLADPKNFGSLLIESSPSGCTIFFNDTLITEYKTPHRISSLLPDIYKVKASYPEHRSDSLFIQVYGSKETIVKLAPIDTTIWVNYNRSNSKISDNVIYDLFIDESNLIWMGSRLGIIQLRGNYWNNYNYSNAPLPHIIINKIKKDLNNNYWIGTLSGLVKITSEEWSPYTIENSELPSDYITDIDFDNSGQVWIGTDMGLLKIQDNNWAVLNSSNSGLKGDFIKTITVNKKDNSIWIGTNNSGIAHFDGISRWKYYFKSLPPAEDSTTLSKQIIFSNNVTPSDTFIMRNSVSVLEIDKQGTVWAGFSAKVMKSVIIAGGIQKFSGIGWETIELGFPKVYINDIYVTEDNLKLISTSEGIVILRDYNFMVLDKSNSDLPINWINAVYPDQNGTLWIATAGKGLVKFKNYREHIPY